MNGSRLKSDVKYVSTIYFEKLLSEMNYCRRAFSNLKVLRRQLSSVPWARVKNCDRPSDVPNRKHHPLCSFSDGSL